MKKANTSDGYFRETFTYQGKRYSVRAKTERDLWRKVEEKKRRLEEGVDVTNENTTVDRWLANYLAAYKKGNVTDKTYHQLEAYVKNYISPAIGNRRLKDIQTIDLQLIMNSCAGKSQSQARKLRDIIRQAFKQARISRVLIFDPSEGIVMPKTTNGTHRALTNEERLHIHNVARSHRGGLWVLFMLYTGARPDETRKARWEDIDFKEHTVTLHSAKTDYGDRRVPIPARLYKRLKWERQDSGYLFTQPTTGKPHTETSMKQMWRSFKQALDLDMGAQMAGGAIDPETSVVADDLTPYCLRHTYATDLQSAGVPLNVAKDLLGHQSIAMTSQIYTHLSVDAFADASLKVINFQHAQQRKEKRNLLGTGDTSGDTSNSRK